MTTPETLIAEPQRPAYARIKVPGEEAIMISLAELGGRYNSDGNDGVQRQINTAFHQMLGASIDFLQACKNFENQTGMPIAKGGSPPRYYYEELEQLEKQALPQTDREALHLVTQADLDKCVATIFCISTAKSVLRATRGEEPPLLDSHKMAGSIIRQVLNHMAQYHGAEINMCKNPDTRLKIMQKLAADSLQPA